MSFRAFLSQSEAELAARIRAARTADVERALAAESRTEADLAALLSAAAAPYVEEMAREAQRLTRAFFGRTISLYAPLYLSNVCAADCTYCGYSVKSGSRQKRLTLPPESIRTECRALASRRFQSILLLTGETRHATPVDYIADAVSIAREYVPSVSIEVYSLDEPDYRRLCGLGLDGVTIYMETYDRTVYEQVHLLGEKRDFDYRLDAIERAGRAGARRLNIGVLLGLADWRLEGYRLGLHARYLQKTCWQSSVSISFPRLRHVPERFDIPRFVSDRDLVQYMLALRLFLPEAGFNLSTREAPALRDRLIPLGITSMSAASSTRPGGYATYGENVLEQFEIEDHRRVDDVVAAIRRAGYDPVWKDFDYAFDAAPVPETV